MPAKKRTAVTERTATGRRSRSGAAAKVDGGLSFRVLVDSILQVHEQCAAQANRAVNVNLTLRNWVIGWYVREYQQNGADRANYGESLLDKVAERLGAAGLDELSARYLRFCRHFAAVYPTIWRSVTAKSVQALLPDVNPPSDISTIWQAR